MTNSKPRTCAHQGCDEPVHVAHHVFCSFECMDEAHFDWAQMASGDDHMADKAERAGFGRGRDCTATTFRDAYGVRYCG